MRDHIPFIVDGKQIYLPFMAVYLQERCDSERSEITSILPSAQLLLLYYIYHGCGELTASDAANALSFSATSISRAFRQLEDLGLIQTEKRGVHKVLYSEKKPGELFEAAKSYLTNPVKRTIYVPKAEIKEKLLVSGYSALSEYSMLNPPAVECYATESIAAWEKTASGKLQNWDDQCAVELWRYDPKKLSNDESVDRLSLALALGEDRDERIEETVEEMLTGGEKAFFIEFFLCNPDLAEEEPVFGQLPENRQAHRKPSYLMVKAGCWARSGMREKSTTLTSPRYGLM